jgi:hypothetical protein
LIIETRRNLLDAQQPDARCRELQRQRHAIQPAAHFDNRGGVLGRDAEIGPGRPRAFDEQHCGGILGKCLVCRWTSGLRHIQ